uniref:Uncharacterized protein n=1 Tax=Solanum lycopersicum TaxID=4081 RepID=K4C4F8_SOLLC
MPNFLLERKEKVVIQVVCQHDVSALAAGGGGLGTRRLEVGGGGFREHRLEVGGRVKGGQGLGKDASRLRGKGGGGASRLGYGGMGALEERCVEKGE